MSTRKSKDDSVLNQSKFASSPDFERGLIANLVAKRAALLEDKSDRELLWFIQYLSHQDGGLAAMARDIIAKYPDRIQTHSMAELKLKPGKTCKADEVKIIRKGFPNFTRYILKCDGINDIFRCPREDDENNERHVDHNPESYEANDFFDHCADEARRNLQNEIAEICLNPARDLSDGNPWYFPRLVQTLREHQTSFVQAKTAGAVVTTLGKKVAEVLDYTHYSRGLSLVEGNARLGKSFAAKSWCSLNPGKARFVEVPPFNDDIGFFQALARGLGLGNFLNYKSAQIRQRVESVLLTGDLILVLDESQRLWPLHDLRRGHPNRIVWLMTMANAGVPICCICTQQFIAAQNQMEKSGWNSAQLTGRIGHFETLPAELSEEDLMAVAKSVLPESNEKVQQALATYARTSARYLAAIDSISKRARYLASRDGRSEATTADVRSAMKESVIGSDTRLNQALESGRKTGAARRVDLVKSITGDAGADQVAPARRGISPASGSRITDEFSPALTAG